MLNPVIKQLLQGALCIFGFGGFFFFTVNTYWLTKVALLVASLMRFSAIPIKTRWPL